MTKRRSPGEALAWLLFSAGGMASALFIPALLLLFGVAFPMGWLTPPTLDHLLNVLSNPFTRIGLLILCVLSLAHWAHRFRHVVNDMTRLDRMSAAISALCYLVAVAASVWAAIVLFQ